MLRKELIGARSGASLHRVRLFPYSLQTARFSRKYLQFRPWKPSSNDPTVGRMYAAIEALNIVGTTTSITPTRAVFGSATTFLTMVGVCFPLFCGDGSAGYAAVQTAQA